MFSRTRKRIVISITAVLILLLSSILAVIYGSSYHAVRKQNREMLERYVGMYSLESLPGDGLPEMPPGDVPASQLPDPNGQEGEPSAVPEDAPPGESDLFTLSSFYSVAISSDGEILATDTGMNGRYSETEVSAVADEILTQNKASGRFNNYLYIVDSRDDYTLVAFMDTSLTEDSMRKVLINTMLTGALAVIILFIAAVYLAKVIVKPLEENDRKQKQFISDAGHELKTPVAVIGANSEILSKELGDNEWLSNIRYENDRMGSLITELLELSRVEKTAAEMETTDLSKLVMGEVLPFESVAFERGIGIDQSIEPAVMVKGNRRQLCQLVSILTDNAISYSTGDTVKVELVKEHGDAVLRVRNRGIEISADACDKIFDRFYRMDEAREEDGHYGLGLPIAKAIVQAHKGKISAECHEGTIVFTASMPLEK